MVFSQWTRYSLPIDCEIENIVGIHSKVSEVRSALVPMGAGAGWRDFVSRLSGVLAEVARPADIGGPFQQTPAR